VGAHRLSLLAAHRVVGACDVADARARHRWQLPARYSIAEDALFSRRPGAIAALGEHAVPITFGEVQAAAARFAGGLRAMGVREGDVVALYLSPAPETAVAVFGALALGAIVLPIPRILAGDAVGYRLADARAAVLVTDGPGADRLRETGCDLSGVQRITLDGSSGRPYADLLGAEPVAPVTLSPEDPALLVYTSGTSGRPKGILHAQRVLLGHAGLDYAFAFYRPDDVYFGTADWGWVGGIMLGLLAPWAHGVPIVANRAQGFDPEATVRGWAAAGVRIAFLPASVIRMLRAAGVSPDRPLRAVVSGGEPVSPEELEWARANLAASVSPAYGQTEANCLIGQSTVLGVVDSHALGVPYPGHDVLVANETGDPVPAGETGEIFLRLPDPVAMSAYWGRPDEPHPGGLLHTGDTAFVDERGLIHYVGRADDVIKTRGYRVGPAEIEAALMRHPAVADAGVIGVKDPELGERIKAFLCLAQGATDLTPALSGELRDLVRAQVGAHAYPREFAVLAELPRTETGKLRRRSLYEEPVA
jgi:acetyl-CoA synthetase